MGLPSSLLGLQFRGWGVTLIILSAILRNYRKFLRNYQKLSLSKKFYLLPMPTPCLEASRYRGLDIGLSHKRAGIHLNGGKQWSHKGESKLSSLAIFRLFLPMVRVLVLQLGFPCLAAGNVGSWYMTLKEIWLLYLKEVILTKECFPILIFMWLLLCYRKKSIDKCIVCNYLPP